MMTAVNIQSKRFIAPRALIATALAFAWLAVLLPTTATAEACTPADTQRYVFSWNLQQSCLPPVRGGTTRGAPVTLLTEPSAAWQALQAEDISDLERDRRAILAMAGGYRTSFEFIETAGFTPDYAATAPYQSWGTEYVYVLANEKHFISLQHIMVMYLQQPDGTVSEPLVMKHWRQDWRYQDRKPFTYTGERRWEQQKLARRAVKGSWSQTVYQVDDSPRYASYGHWQHTPSFSLWESQDTWRPLPRRESSVRSDYAVLEGINRHRILPTGWVHEEDNLKRVSSNPDDTRYLARELGNNRYERVTDVDFKPGDRYLEKTGAFWAAVRAEWDQQIAKHGALQVQQTAAGVPLFVAMFQAAEQYTTDVSDAPETTSTTLQQQVAALLAPYIDTNKDND